MKYKATALIAQEMDAQGIRYRIYDKGRVEEIDCGFPVDEGPIVHLHMLSGDDRLDAEIRVFALVNGIPKSKWERMLQVCNELNRRFRFAKFVMDEGNLDVEYDLPVGMSEDCVGASACEVFRRFMAILDESWTIIMKALFAGNAAPEDDDADGDADDDADDDENHLLDRIRGALVSEGVALSGNESPLELMEMLRELHERPVVQESAAEAVPDGEESEASPFCMA